MDEIKTSARSSSGQAVVEYLLLLAIIVGIVGGVVRVAAFKWFNTQLLSMQTPLVERLRQSRGFEGIPVRWFFAGRDMNEVDAAFKRADDNRNNNPAGTTSDPTKDPSKNAPDSTNGAGKGGGLGDSENPNSKTPSAGRSPPASVSPKGTDRSSQQANNNSNSNRSQTEDTSEKKSSGKKKSTELGANAYTGELNETPKDENGDGVIDKKDEEIARQNAEEGLTPEMKARRRVLEEDQRSRSGGCRQLSTFELIRIAIFVMLAFIAFIIFFASRGKGGDQ